MRAYNQTPIEVENEIVSLYTNGDSSLRIQRKTGVNPTTVFNILKRRNLKARSYSEMNKKYIFDESFFKKIDSEEKAYWYGFILADGCICRNDLIISVNFIDEAHLYKFLKSINGDNKIQTKTVKTNFGTSHMSKLSIRSHKIFKDLQKHGLTPNKTFTVKAPNLINQLKRHFWRGVIDGDGYLGFWKQRYKNNIHKTFAIELTGNKYIINAFINYINESLGIKGKRFKDKSVFRSRFACKKGTMVADLLYKGSKIYLDRKYEVYKRI